MTDKMTTLHGGLKDTELNATVEDGATWYEAAPGERIAIHISSLDTNAAFAVVESISAPGSAVSLYLHQNEEEHFVILPGTFRFVCDDKMFNASAGTSVTVPKGAKHAWRNLSNEPGRMLVVFTPGGFERCIRGVIGLPREEVVAFAASHGCLIVGPPINA
jgi:mannose-6-phosphate isomerase-like protein (cupin superfamily)